MSQKRYIDNLMSIGECSLSFVCYQLILIAGPINISKTHMLKTNQRIYVILFFIMGSVKLTIQSLFFDDNLDYYKHLFTNDYIKNFQKIRSI
jgi:hypothetical protein